MQMAGAKKKEIRHDTNTPPFLPSLSFLLSHQLAARAVARRTRATFLPCAPSFCLALLLSLWAKARPSHGSRCLCLSGKCCGAVQQRRARETHLEGDPPGGRRTWRETRSLSSSSSSLTGDKASLWPRFFSLFLSQIPIIENWKAVLFGRCDTLNPIPLERDDVIDEL